MRKQKFCLSFMLCFNYCPDFVFTLFSSIRLLEFFKEILLLPSSSSPSLITSSGTACLQTTDYGLTVNHRQSQRVPAVTVTDLEFADDLALLSNTIQDAQSLLHDLEVVAEQVGLFMNTSKTEFMTVNIDHEEASIQANNGDSLEHVHDFKYPGSYIADSRKDLNTRKGMAWTACIKPQKVWTSGISEHQEVKFFKACVKPVLLYGSET